MALLSAIPVDGTIDGTESLLGQESNGTVKRFLLSDLQTFLSGVTSVGTTFTGSILPNADDSLDIGSNAAQWKDIYIDGVAYLDTVDIDAGAIDGTAIGANSESTGKFTTLQLTSGTNILSDLLPTDGTFDLGSSTREFQDLYIDGTAYLDAVDIDSGAIDGTPIGANSHSTGKFTTLEATGALTDGSGDVGTSGQVLSSTGSITNWITISSITGLIENNSVFVGQDPSSTTSTASNNVSVGVTALDAITTGDNNVAIGQGALTNATTSGSNVAVGDNSLQAVTTNTGLNTAVGSGSGQAVTTGNYNVLVGYQSGTSTTVGDENTAVGYRALKDNVDGSRNVAIGYESLTALDPASEVSTNNTALGYQSGLAVTTGTQNVIIGQNAGDAITTSSLNTIVGAGAASADFTGYNGMTAVGMNAAALATTGGDFFGASSFTNLTSGSGNCGFGLNAGKNVQTGGQNSFFGTQAGQSNSGLTSDSGNTGLGYQSLTALNGGDENTSIGAGSGSSLTSGNHSVLIGHDAGNVITTGSNSIIIGESADPSSATTDNEIVIGQGATGEGANKTVIGNSSTVGARVFGLRTPVTNITSNTSLGANDSGETFVFNDADGAIITLPDSGGGDLTGVYYTFIIGVTATSNAHKVVLTDTTNEKLYGQVLTVDTDTSDANASFAAQAGDSFSAISSNGTTTGIIGSKYTVTNFGADKWYAEGTMHVTGSPATPFATS